MKLKDSTLLERIVDIHVRTTPLGVFGHVHGDADSCIATALGGDDVRPRSLVIELIAEDEAKSFCPAVAPSESSALIFEVKGRVCLQTFIKVASFKAKSGRLEESPDVTLQILPVAFENIEQGRICLLDTAPPNDLRQDFQRSNAI
ncbi:hypothetical protein C5D36_10270 [Rathayibacter sp. AY1C6]|nr:hypothetical protein C5D36_10270 [Rathayibacter sp. AY1C6]